MHLWKQIEKVWLKNDKDKCIFHTDRRNLNIWITEHKQATKNCDLNKNISEHHIKPKHIRLNQKAISKFPSASFSKRG